MWRKKHYILFNGRKITVRALANAFNVPYDNCLKRFHQGISDPWEILFGPGGKPVSFKVSKEQIAYLQETRYYRKGQVAVTGKAGHRDSEWDIACDLVGIPRAFSEELKEAVCAE